MGKLVTTIDTDHEYKWELIEKNNNQARQISQC